MRDLEKNIETALQYAERIIGTKYEYWYEGTELSNQGPMWVSTEAVPSSEIVRGQSVNCVGLINLMRRVLQLTIPGIGLNVKYPGGIYEWYRYLTQKNALHKFDYTLTFKRGTLFLRQYESEHEQGHVSVLYEENKESSLYSIIIHSSVSTPFQIHTKLDPGVNIDHTLGQSHFYYKYGYYQHYCLPEDWLI